MKIKRASETRILDCWSSINTHTISKMNPCWMIRYFLGFPSYMCGEECSCEEDTLCKDC